MWSGVSARYYLADSLNLIQSSQCICLSSRNDGKKCDMDLP